MSGSAIPWGVPVPGMGRSFYVGLAFSFQANRFRRASYTGKKLNSEIRNPSSNSGEAPGQFAALIVAPIRFYPSG